MEFTKEISFEEKLTADKVAKINYHGKLLNTNSDSISIVYGYGQNWDYTDEKSMVKVDNGYEVEIPMKSYDTFNFCFKDGYNNWDNNSQFNYISPIEKNENHSSGTGSGGKKKNVKESAEEQDIVIDIPEVVDEDDSVSTNVDLAEIENEISRIFDELFGVTEQEYTVEGAFNQIFAEAGYDQDYDSYRAEVYEAEKQVQKDDDKELTVEDAFNELFKEAGYEETYQSYRQYMDTVQEVERLFNELFEESGENSSNIELAAEAGPSDKEDEEISDIEEIFNILFEEAGYVDTYASYRQEIAIKEEVANAFNQLFEEAGYVDTYASYRQEIAIKEEVANAFNQLFAEAGYEETYDSYIEEAENKAGVAGIFNQLFAEAGYTDTYASYREDIDVKQDVADTFNQLFAEAGYEETYDSYSTEQEVKAEVVSAFNQLFAEAGYDMDYQAYRDSVFEAQYLQEDIEKAETADEKEDLDALVDEILKPITEEYNVPEEIAKVNEFSTVDDFDGIDIKNIELDSDIDNYEVDDSTREELQKLIEEIDSQIALFENNNDQVANTESTIEQKINDVEETIEVPTIKNIEASHDDVEGEERANVSNFALEDEDPNVDIDQLFDYLKKYDDELEDESVEEDEEETEEKTSLFEDVDTSKDEPTIVNEENDEQSIFEKVKEQKQEKIEDESQELTVSSRKLRHFYKLSKRIKLAFMKVFYGLPKILGSNKSSDNDD